MKYSGHRKLLCELSKFSKLNAFILLGYQTNTDASILVYKFRPERTGFNLYAEYATTINFPCIITLVIIGSRFKSVKSVTRMPGDYAPSPRKLEYNVFQWIAWNTSYQSKMALKHFGNLNSSHSKKFFILNLDQNADI